MGVTSKINIELQRAILTANHTTSGMRIHAMPIYTPKLTSLNSSESTPAVAKEHGCYPGNQLKAEQQQRKIPVRSARRTSLVSQAQSSSFC
mmetsp:Transcript_142380/g.248299  ORF Transcript_142380/g.248299 Transcript_142380/m.248299 type:complete len:91 (-) Transcript_142380:3919-4191(-)